MKTYRISMGLLALTALCSLPSFGDGRTINMKTEIVDGATHWMPEKVEVRPGEKVKFVVTHKLKEGFNLHGFSIPTLKIAKQVDRDKELTIPVEIPADLKPGEYEIGCQFHPKHVGAKLVVK